MPRKQKSTLEFIQLDCFDKTTIKRLNRKYGKEGRIFWIDLLRLLGRTEWYLLDLSDEEILEDIMIDELDIEVEKGKEILNQLSKWGNICKNTWENHRKIWCQNLIDRHIEVFNKRKKIPRNPYTTVISASEILISDTETAITDAEMQQIKVNKSKVNKIKVTDVVDYSSSSSSFFSIEVLVQNYLNNDKVVNEVIKNKENKFRDRQHLIEKITLFQKRLLQDNILVKTETDFASHFRRWNKLNEKEFQGQVIGTSNQIRK